MQSPNEAGASEPTEQTASAPQETTPADKQTTTQPRAEGTPRQSEAATEESDSAQELMHSLGIDPAIQAQIAPESKESHAKSTTGTTGTAASHSEAATGKAEGEAVTGEKIIEDDDGDEDDDLELGDNNQQTQGEQQRPDKRQKRINRLTRQKSELEDKLDLAAVENQKLRDQLAAKDGAADTAASTPTPRPGSRLSNIQTETDLDKAITTAEAWVDWCDANPEGVTQGEGENQRFIGPQDIAKIRRANEKVILLAPNRRQEIQRITQERRKYDTIAQQAWPELFDTSSDEHKIAGVLEKTYPFLKDIPARNYAIGLLVEGMKSLYQRANPPAPNGNGNGSRTTTSARTNGDGKEKAISPRAFEPRAPIAPARPDAPTREVVPSSSKQFNQAMTDLVAGGGRDALIAAITAMDAADAPNKSPSERLVKA